MPLSWQQHWLMKSYLEAMFLFPNSPPWFWWQRVQQSLLMIIAGIFNIKNGCFHVYSANPRYSEPEHSIKMEMRECLEKEIFSLVWFMEIVVQRSNYFLPFPITFLSNSSNCDFMEKVEINLVTNAWKQSRRKNWSTLGSLKTSQIYHQIRENLIIIINLNDLVLWNSPTWSPSGIGFIPREKRDGVIFLS